MTEDADEFRRRLSGYRPILSSITPEQRRVALSDQGDEVAGEPGYWRLSPNETKAFVAALENPPAPSQRAINAARRYLDRFINWSGGR